MKRKNKKQKQKIVVSMFARIHSVFSPIVEWFEMQIKSGESLVDSNGVMSIVTNSNQIVCPVWESIEAMEDLSEMGLELRIFHVEATDLAALKGAIKFDLEVSQELFMSAYKQLLNIRDALLKLPAVDTILIANRVTANNIEAEKKVAA